MDMNERRSYQRASHFYIIAKISLDGKVWKDAEVYDLSSGGLQLNTDEVFQTGDVLWLDLLIHGFFTEFEIKVQASIRRVKPFEGHHLYGVAFIDLSHDLKIRIDENVQNDRPVGGNPYSLN